MQDAHLVLPASMDVPPVVQPATPPPPPRSGCFAKGCLALLIAAGVLLALVIAGGWFAFNYVIRTFTTARPRTVQVEEGTSQQVQTAEAKMETLRAAIRNKQETTIELTAVDLNMLIAHDTGFSDARGRAHVDITGSTILLELSAPLSSFHWQRLRSRWFSGRVQFGLSYVDDEFSFDVKSGEANGHSVPGALFSAEFSRSFNRSFNESFHRESHRHNDDLWRHLRMVSVQNDKLIVTTRGM